MRGSTSNPAKESQERLPGGGDIRAVSFSIGVRLGEKKSGHIQSPHNGRNEAFVNFEPHPKLARALR